MGWLKIAQNHNVFNSNENHCISSNTVNNLVNTPILPKQKFPTSAELRSPTCKYSNIAARVLNVLTPEIVSQLRLHI